MSASRLASPHRPLLLRALGGGLALCAALAFPRSGAADPETEARYPFDPACPWGRISNGKGMLNRCISEAEAQKLVTDAKKPPAPGPAGATASGVTAGGATTATPGEPSPAETPMAPTSPAAKVPVLVKLGPIVAEQGEVALGKLGKPLDKYTACIDDNGGLTQGKGSVTVQFLVRAEFGRAEGVEVKKASGVSAKAARCLADVVDRRQVGATSVPLTGATLSFEITPSK